MTRYVLGAVATLLAWIGFALALPGLLVLRASEAVDDLPRWLRARAPGDDAP